MRMSVLVDAILGLVLEIAFFALPKKGKKPQLAFLHTAGRVWGCLATDQLLNAFRAGTPRLMAHDGRTMCQGVRWGQEAKTCSRRSLRPNALHAVARLGWEAVATKLLAQLRHGHSSQNRGRILGSYGVC